MISPLQSTMGGMLNTLVEAQRGMTDAEAERFMRTGVVPDLSEPPLEESGSDNQVIMSSADASAWLGGEALTASSFLDFDSQHGVSPFCETMGFDFDPHEPRGHDGKWTKIKGLLGKKISVDKTDADITSEFEHTQRTLHSVTAVSTLGPDVERASAIYQQHGYRDINAELRESHGEKVNAVARTLSGAMSPAKDNIVVQRGIARPRAMFGDSWNSTPGANVGLEWVDHGFTSTTARSSHNFLWDMVSGEMADSLYILRINVPAGTRALHLNADNYDDESEILLDRGTRFRVTGDKMIDGARTLDVEVVSQEARNV